MFRREGELNSEAYGSYADVSKTEAWFEGKIRMQVAVKRLRFLGIQDPHRLTRLKSVKNAKGG